MVIPSAYVLPYLILPPDSSPLCLLVLSYQRRAYIFVWLCSVLFCISRLLIHLRVSVSAPLKLPKAERCQTPKKLILLCV